VGILRAKIALRISSADSRCARSQPALKQPNDSEGDEPARRAAQPLRDKAPSQKLALTTIPKKFLQHFRRFAGQHATSNFHPMIQSRVV